MLNITFCLLFEYSYWSHSYLRPETAQIGNSFRNEISPPSGLLGVRYVVCFFRILFDLTCYP
jgi:glycyl-tRNA synthetase (class II)